MATIAEFPAALYESEKRIAVVMYGGVSLAIYIAGVAKELLSVVRATSPSPDDPQRAGVADTELSAVEKIYREAASANGVLKTRVIVDVVSGTSAGGINGIFLAKALAGNLSMDRILKLWIEEGDFAKLVNDGESVKGTGLSPDDPPPSLLNGRRMYAKLLEALDAMETDARQRRAENGTAAGAPDGAYDASRVDLFVTATDIAGEPFRLAVANALARELRHRQRFHFTSYGPGPGELSEGENALLAFAARCTSSFPVAFEPFTWRDAVAIAGGSARRIDWTSRLLYVGTDYDQRAFGDGGYLDNKPFSYAVDELARRQSYLPVDRLLLYVEPDPEKLGLMGDEARRLVKLDAFKNAVAALTLPGYETIREDLQRVSDRNARVEELIDIEQTVDETLKKYPEHKRQPLSAEAWLAVDEDALVEKYGPGYPAYHRIKIASVVAALADIVCSVGGIGRPELAQVIRELVLEWSHAAFPKFKDELTLLLDADLDYRLRKLSFVLRRAADAPEQSEEAVRKELSKQYNAIYAMRKRMREQFGAIMKQLRSHVLTDERLEQIASLERDDRKQAVRDLLAATKSIDELKSYLEGTLRRSLMGASNAVVAALASSPRLRLAYSDFEYYDMIVYPIVRHGNVDEAVDVEVVRISPEETATPRARPLAGVRLGHFGAFLEEDWRRNDILCGRLDAAEVLLSQLVPDPTPFVDRAHQAIVAEALLPGLRNRLASARLPEKTREETLRAIGDPASLCALFKDGAAYDLDPDYTRQVGSAGRAGIVLEKIIRDWAMKARFPFPAVIRWAVLLVAMLGQIAIPRSLPRTIARHWGRLLGLVFVVATVAGVVTKQSDLTSAGVKGLAILASLTLAVLIIGSAIGERTARRVLRFLQWSAVAGLALFAGWAVRLPPMAVRERLGMDDWWTPMDAVALEVIAVGLAIGLLLSLYSDLRFAVVWVWRRFAVRAGNV